MRIIEWEVKVTKLCNLRCAYCYEYDELGDPHRLSLADWRAILESARWYHEALARREPGGVATRFVWHGGESSVLPPDYFEEVVSLQREVLAGLDFVNHASTNLYRLRPELLELWDREGFVIAVSYDGAPGARVTADGRETDAVVAENLERLLSRPRTIGCNSVLSAANLPHLVDIYDRLRDLVHGSPGTLYWNLIPVHSTARDHPRTAPLHLDQERAVGALLRLFRHWLDDPAPISLSPLQQHYLAAARTMLGLPRHWLSRRRDGETSLTVNTDGHVYLFRDIYDRSKSLGSVFERPLAELMRLPAYEASLRRTEAETAALCDGCAYDGQCNHGALIHGHGERPGGRCGLTHALLRGIEAELAARGIPEEIRAGRWQGVPNCEFLLQSAA